MLRKTILILGVFAVAVSVAAKAEIVLLTNGRTLKVTAWEVGPEQARLKLAGGGEVELSMSRIERIIDDEVVPVEPAMTALPEQKWGFDESSQPLFATRFDPIIIEAARKFDVDAALVSAVIKAESDYNPKVVSNKGAQGLMQLMPATAKRFGVTDAFDPHANIHAGTRYLRWLLNRFDGNVELALAGYNAGEGNVARYNGVPPFRETIEYIRRIGRHFEKKRGVALVSTSGLESHSLRNAGL
ncbi:MAG TPA: lytic transglycosylase domain-containing protein [Thermoanaerobaculia bacterium]|nr:lytic transglycosylase domain-containing protein [Thermoanaerobaculia bacterium]